MFELPPPCSCECEHRGCDQWDITKDAKTKNEHGEEEQEDGVVEEKGTELHNAMGVVDNEQTGEGEGARKVHRVQKMSATPTSTRLMPEAQMWLCLLPAAHPLGPFHPTDAARQAAMLHI
jgi:hypothetical protein